MWNAIFITDTHVFSILQGEYMEARGEKERKAFVFIVEQQFYRSCLHPRETISAVKHFP